jgi:hypothetical protein
MSVFVPHFKLYASNGTTLLYTFLCVQATNIPQTTIKKTVIEGIRGIGGIVIGGSESSWNIIIKGIIIDINYDNITTKIDAMESALQLNTPYILVFDKTISTSYQYNVKRIEPITYADSLRTSGQEYTVTLLANSW